MFTAGVTSLSSFRNIILAAAGSLALMSCEHIGKGANDIADGFSAFGSDVVSVIRDGSQQSAQPQMEGFSTQAYQTGTYAEMTRTDSGGSVEIYDLDAEYPYTRASVNEVQDARIEEGSRILTDSNVTVYPLDGGVPRTEVSAPGLMPPSGAAQPYQSPFNQSYAPAASPAYIYFNNGSSSLGQYDKIKIEDVSDKLRMTNYSNLVQVEGHASTKTATRDPVQKRIVNLKMSMDRAMNVSRQLIKEGVPADIIQTTAWGDTRAPAATDGMSADAAARRVEILTPAIP